MFKGITENWRDFQREYCDLLGIEVLISLECAVGFISEKFVGKMHDALWDAGNTASTYALSKDVDEFNKVMNPIIEVLRPGKPMTYCLGEIFQNKMKAFSVV